MSSFLFVVPPLVGHINPTVGVATELLARGHRVAWVGHAELVRHLAGQDMTVFDCVAGPAESAIRPPELRGPAALEFLWSRFLVPLARAMAPGVRTAIDRYQPDALVVDQQALAGGLLAEDLGVPWMTSATTSAELVDPLAGMPKVAKWVLDLIADLRSRLGLLPSPVDPRFSPYGVLAFSTAELVGALPTSTGTVHFVGPSLAIRPSVSDFPWSWLDPTVPTVLVTLGTANADAGGRFLASCAEALADRATRLRAILVDPTGILVAPAAVRSRMLVRAHVPQLELLPRLAAVVCHGGHNTVCESLWHGVPLVVAPIRDDQPIVAQQVVDAGAGVRVRFNRATPAQLGAAVDAVLTPTGGYRTAAAAIGHSFHAAGGAEAAADHLEQLTGHRRPTSGSGSQHG
jgi:zeaxanthin glucosyltransferase